MPASEKALVHLLHCLPCPGKTGKYYEYPDSLGRLRWWWIDDVDHNSLNDTTQKATH